MFPGLTMIVGVNGKTDHNTTIILVVVDTNTIITHREGLPCMWKLWICGVVIGTPEACGGKWIDMEPKEQFGQYSAQLD